LAFIESGRNFSRYSGSRAELTDQDPGTVGRAAEEVDRLEDRLLDEDDPVGAGILVHEAVHDRGVTEPRVAADQAVGAVRVVYVVADVVGVEAEHAGRAAAMHEETSRASLSMIDAAGPDRKLVIHGVPSSGSRDCIPSSGY